MINNIDLLNLVDVTLCLGPDTFRESFQSFYEATEMDDFFKIVDIIASANNERIISMILEGTKALERGSRRVSEILEHIDRHFE